ncbi:MAG TPA: hypothetical protein VFO01_02710 [Trebonia sp.]|nr:hypothetical protein [Trebonia sp.]
MTVDKRQVPESSPEDLSDLLSEVRRADVLANDPCTREFLQAGERLLHDILTRDTGEVSGRARAPFYELLACVSRRQVVDEAEGVVFRALLPETKQVPPSARPLDHHKPTSLLAKIAMAIIVAFTDPGDGEPLRHVVRRLAEAA